MVCVLIFRYCDKFHIIFVIQDVDTIYLSHNTKEFKLQDFDHLDQK